MTTQRYKLGFVRAIKAQNLLYREEVLALMDKHGMSAEDKQVIADNKLYRWYPHEVFAALEAPR